MPARWVPSWPDISREALAVIAGAIIAAIVFEQLPELRRWVAARLPTRD